MLHTGQCSNFIERGTYGGRNNFKDRKRKPNRTKVSTNSSSTGNNQSRHESFTNKSAKWSHIYFYAHPTETGRAYWEQRIGYFDELLEKQNIGELEHRSMGKWSVQLIDYRCLARPDSPIHTKRHQPIPGTLHPRLVSNKSDFPSASSHQLHHFLIVLDAVYESIERVKKCTAMKKFGIPIVQCTTPFFLSCP